MKLLSSERELRRLLREELLRLLSHHDSRVVEVLRRVVRRRNVAHHVEGVRVAREQLSENLQVLLV